MTKILVDSELLMRMIGDVGDPPNIKQLAEDIETIRAALDAPQQEAVAHVWFDDAATAHFELGPPPDDGCDALYLHPAPSVPEGWQLVPKEPTPAMKQAGWGSNEFQRTAKYHAMLSAAPKSPSADDRKDAEIAKLVRMKLTSGNGIPVERCTIRASEIAAIDTAIAEQKGEKE